MQKEGKERPSILAMFLKIPVLLQGSTWSLLRDTVQLNFAVEVWDILLFWDMACDATDHIKEKTLVRAMT